MRRSLHMLANLSRLRSEFIDSRKATDQESDSDKEKRVGEKRVDGDCCDDYRIVAREVSSLFLVSFGGKMGVRLTL